MRPRIALVHAVREAIEPIEAALGKLWPEAEPMHLLDDRLSVDRAMETGLSPDMYRRISELGTYTLVPSRAVLKFGWRDLQHRHRIGSSGEVNRLLCG